MVDVSTRNSIHRLVSAAVSQSRAFQALALAGATVFLGLQGQRMFAKYGVGGLCPDLVGQIQTLEVMRHPYATYTSEPVWMWLLQLSRWTLGTSYAAYHLLGALLFVSAAYLVFFFTKEVFKSFLTGVVAFCLFVNNEYLWRMFIECTRDNLFMNAMLAVCFFSLARPEWLTQHRRLLGLTLSAVVMIGTRINSLAPLLVLLTYVFFREGKSLRFILIPLPRSP